MEEEGSAETAGLLQNGGPIVERFGEIIRHRIGVTVRVMAPLKVYLVSKVDLTGMEGEVKQYVGLWKEKSIFINLLNKVEFLMEVEGRSSPVKFSAHLRDDEVE